MGGGNTKETMDENHDQLQSDDRTWSEQEWQEWEEWMDTDDNGYGEGWNSSDQRWSDEEWEAWEEWKTAHGYGGWPYELGEEPAIITWTEDEWLVWESQVYSMEERNEWYKKGWHETEDSDNTSESSGWTSNEPSEELWTWTDEEWRIWEGQEYTRDEKNEWYRKGWTDPEEKEHEEEWEEWKRGEEEEPPKKTRRV